MFGKHRGNPALLGLSLGFLALAGGCQQFFTTSFAKPLARPPVTLTSITANQAAALVAAKPNQSLAASAVGALSDLVNANPTSASVVSDAAQVAVVATGLDTALTQALGTVSMTNLTAGTLSATDMTTIANLVTTASANVTPATSNIFSTLATQSATDPAALSSNGVTSQTLVVAAAAVAINDMKTTLANSGSTTTITEVINGTASAPPLSASAQATISDLKSGVTAIDPNNQLLSVMNSSLNLSL